MGQATDSLAFSTADLAAAALSSCEDLLLLLDSDHEVVSAHYPADFAADSRLADATAFTGVVANLLDAEQAETIAKALAQAVETQRRTSCEATAALVDKVTATSWVFSPQGDKGVLVRVRRRSSREGLEAELEHRTATLRLLFDNSPDLIIIQDLNCIILDANTSACRALRESREQLVGRPLTDFVPPAYRQRLARTMPVWVDGGIAYVTCALQSADGEEIEVEVFGDRTIHEGKEAVLTEFRDLATRKLGEETLLKQTDLLRGLNDLSISLTTAPADADYYTMIADALRHLTGALGASCAIYDPKQKAVFTKKLSTDKRIFDLVERVIGQKIATTPYPVNRVMYDRLVGNRVEMFHSAHSLFLGAIPKSVGRLLDKLLGIGHTYGLAHVYAGELLGTSIIAMPSQAQPLPLGALEVCSNVVSAFLRRLRNEQTITEYQARLKALASEISLAEERERRRIAAALHDRVTQTLALTQMKLGELARLGQGADAEERLRELREVLDVSITEMRTLTFELSPPILYDLGLEPAIEWLAETMQERHGIACTLACKPGPSKLHTDLRVVLFQAVRELLVNVAKHAQANRVEIAVQRKRGAITITVADNGVGFDPSERAAAIGTHCGLGLFSIRERMAQMGGHMGVTSSPNEGTTVTLTAQDS